MCSSVRPNINGESSCASLPFVFHLPDFPHINGLIISRVGEPSAFLGKTRNITIIIVSFTKYKKTQVDRNESERWIGTVYSSRWKREREKWWFCDSLWGYSFFLSYCWCLRRESGLVLDTLVSLRIPFCFLLYVSCRPISLALLNWRATTCAPTFHHANKNIKLSNQWFHRFPYFFVLSQREILHRYWFFKILLICRLQLLANQFHPSILSRMKRPTEMEKEMGESIRFSYLAISLYPDIGKKKNVNCCLAC